jgi:ABC-type Co2+ transport system permease subunit
MMVALLVAIGLGVQNFFHVSWGTGQHGANLPSEKILVPTLKHWYAYQMIYPWSIFFVKAPSQALYHRIFDQTKLRYTVYTVAVFVTIFTVVVFFVNVERLKRLVMAYADLLGIRMSEQSVSSVGTDLPSRLQQSTCKTFFDRVDQHFD